MKKSLIITLLLAASTTTQAQRRIIAYDPELNEPVKDALVWVDHEQAASTNQFGEIQIPDKFDTLHVNKPGYVSVCIPAEVAADSIPLSRLQEHRRGSGSGRVPQQATGGERQALDKGSQKGI